MGKRISPRQREVAAQRLAMGRPAEEVASAVGVSAQTLRRWRSHDAEFRQLIEQYRGAPMLRGIEKVAERGGTVRVKAKRGASPTETVMGSLIQLGQRRGGWSRVSRDEPPPAA